MSERALRLANVGAAALVIGGGLLIALPQHGVSILQLVLATLAGAAGLYALAAHVPTGGWLSPFKWMSPFHPTALGRPRDRHEAVAIRRKLSGWRRPMEGGPAMPPDVVRLLRPLVASALEIDPEDERAVATARARLSPLARAVLGSDSSRWIPKLPPNAREVADAVVRLLDETDRLATGAVDPSPAGPS